MITDLADGNLKSTLLFVGNIRKHCVSFISFTTFSLIKCLFF